MSDDRPPTGRPARWSTRFGAWLVDVVLVAAIVSLVGDLLGLGPGLLESAGSPVGVGRQSLLLFGYWTLFEGRAGQSPGKLVLDLRVVRADGEPLSYADAALESFGKAFLLPLDVLVGAVAMPGERRRLFNRLSGTVVFEVDDPGRTGGAAATSA